MRFISVVVLLVLLCGCPTTKYEMALRDLDKDVVLVQSSLVQAMDTTDKIAGKTVFDVADREARVRTCFEMRAKIWTVLTDQIVKYALPSEEAPQGRLYYEEGSTKVDVDTK